MIKSPIFYMGNKYKLLPQLLPLFPNDITTFYDIFGGSGCVSGNVIADEIIYNELNENIVNLYKLFLQHTPEEIDNKINKYIDNYELNREGTDVRQNNPNIKEIRSMYNEHYLNFRKAYNNSDRDYIMLYTLTFYSFSNLIRFNGDEEFNMPFGNRCYCKKHYEQIKDWCNLIVNKNIEVRNEDAFNILNNTNFKPNDFIYLDPPYTNTLAIYNEKCAHGGWNINSDYELFKILDNLTKKGIKWGMSNVFKNKDSVNTHLIDWCEKNNYYIYHLNKTYSALGKGNANSDEVYICNYSQNKWDDLN